MTRTRPGSIIRQCYNSNVGLEGRAWIDPITTIVKKVSRNRAMTIYGGKIRSWIVVKE